MNYQTILTQYIDGSTGLITFNRPEAANALSRQMAEELAHAVQTMENDSAVRVVVITGTGNKAFCAGADLKERKGMNNEQWHTQHAAFEKALKVIIHCKKPVMAAVNGAAMGGGMELAMACDFIYASSHARMGLTEATLGIMPGMGGTQTLPRAIGTRQAKEALFLGRVASAEEWQTMGLINRIFPGESLLEATLSTAFAIGANAPLSLAAIKRAVDEGINQPLPQALETELHYYNKLLATQDRQEGITAWNEKRKPKFTGS